MLRDVTGYRWISIQFNDDHMTVWHYYQIGNGKIVKYSEVKFVSGVEVISPFVSNHNENRLTVASSQRKDRSAQFLIVHNFTNVEDLDAHVTNGNHTMCEPLTGMDRVRTL